MLSERTWRPEAVIQFCGSLVACFCLAGMAMSLLAKTKLAAFHDEDGFGNVVLGTMSFQGVAWLLIAVFLWQHRVNWREFFGLKDPLLPFVLLVAVVVVLLSLPVMWCLQIGSTWGLTHLGWKPQEETAVQLVEDTTAIGKQIYLAFFAVIMAPVAEEFIFRGMLFPFVRQLGLPRLAWFGVSALFALIHGSSADFIPLFVLALILTWLYVQTDSLLAPVAAHALFNAVNLAILYTGKDGVAT